MGLAVRGSNPGSSYQKRRHWLWKPPNQGSSPDVERPGRGVNSPPPFCTRIKNEWSYASFLLVCHYSVDEENFTFFFLLLIEICKSILVILQRVRALQCLSGWHIHIDFTDWGLFISVFRLSWCVLARWEFRGPWHHLFVDAACGGSTFLQQHCVSLWSYTVSGPKILAPYTLFHTGSVSGRTD
jgi:hypothetical protein